MSVKKLHRRGIPNSYSPHLQTAHFIVPLSAVALTEDVSLLSDKDAVNGERIKRTLCIFLNNS